MYRRRRLIFLVAAVVLVLVAIAFLAAWWWYNTSGAGAHDHVFFFGFGFLGFFLILMIGFWCLRIAMWTTRGPGRYTGSLGGGSVAGGGPYGGARRQWDPAIVEARRRYARGEITREQFQQTIRDLRGSGGGGAGGPLP
jgi:hypothetical protein